jgi:hypothetical protein
MKGLKDLSDKASDYLDKKGLANPVEVANEALGGETREESKSRREKAKDKATKEAPKSDAPKKMAKGGSASSRADGCAIRGKTKGTIVACGGGMMKGKK